MPRLSSYAKERINSLLQQKKYKIIEIVEILKKEDHATDGCKIYTAIYDEPETAICKIENQLADDRN
jgi:hypothetical protein